ncbi:MAG: LacI family DNA-binding transcriptional regulator [Chloroflexi bacterium]|nr:LacI family DNA-binding transcriptional regulator [Chloroflexota bacterium]
MTVSCVISEKGQVSSATRQRVLKEQGSKEARNKEQGSLRPCSPATLLH